MLLKLIIRLRLGLFDRQMPYISIACILVAIYTYHHLLFC